jgi:hypothetical protein
MLAGFSNRSLMTVAALTSALFTGGEVPLTG